MSEYLSGNGMESRTDWDPDQPRLTWKDTEYYHQDILGSVAALTDRHGVVRERYKYDAFGSQYEGSFQRINELGYNGKRYDGATGWYDYGFRDYEAEVGRFTTVDPIRDGGNWYAYVENDPVNFVDPLGLSPSDRNVAADARAMEVAAAAQAKFNAMGDAFNVVSTYTAATAYLADKVGGVPKKTISNINAVSAVTGFLAAAPSVYQAYTNPNIDTISTAAGNTASAIAGFPLGFLAGPETTAVVKAAGKVAKKTAEIDQSIRKDPIGVLESIFTALVTYK